MKKIIFLASLIVVLFTGCLQSPDFDELSYQFIVSTSLDKNADFGSYNTYAISDTVIYIGGIGSDSILVGAEADLMVQTVVDNMTEKGYTRVPRVANPDLGLTLSAIKDINVVVDYYPGWWDPYYGGCYWYYWCYGYYYPWTTVYTYTTGTVILNMYDLKNADANSQLRAVWNTTALGALGSSPSTNINLAVTALDQGFAQSPYLTTN